MPPRRKRPPTNENEPSSSFSTSSIAQPRITRSKSARQPPNLKPLQPSSTVVSSIASVEEEEEEIEEVKSTSSDEEEQQRFERVGEVGSAASVVSVDLEGESAIGGEESGDAGSTASQEDDGSVDSEEQDEEEHACFLEKPLEMMPNKLFVSEKASLSEEVPSGWFKIYKQLGKGAFGVVFRAQHVDAPVKVYAMKVIKISTKKQRADLKRELDAQQDCDGKFTLPILGATTLSTPLGSSCIIMPVAVGSLAELFQHRDGLKSSNRNKSLLEHFHSLSLKWFTEICDGLAHIHDQGYAHRDLKPENIFFLARDGVLVPQIGDFGCAQFVEDGQDYGHAGTLPRSGPRHLFVSVRAQAANFIDDEVLLVESVHCAIERSQKLDTGRRSPFGEDVFGLMMLALDLFYTGPPTHFTRLSEIMTEIESDAISPEAFLEDAELHIRAHYKFMNLLVVKNKSTEAAETALPGAPAWLKAFFILAVVEGYRCDDIASFIGPQSVIRRLQGLVPLPSPSSRPPRDLSRLYPSGWTDSLPASQTGKALPLPRAPPTSNTSKTDSDDVEDDRAQSRLPSALAEEMAESLRKGLHRKWPIISRTELDLWINYINAHPEEANIYDREKAVEVGHESRARKDQRDVALFACAMPICSDRTGIGKNGVKKKGRPIKEAILHARISHGLRGGSFTC